MAYHSFDPNDPDAPQEIDLDNGDDDEDTRDCPFCGRAIHWDAVKCNRCGHRWIRRHEKLPKVCPNCKSDKWNQPRKVKS